MLKPLVCPSDLTSASDLFSCLRHQKSLLIGVGQSAKVTASMLVESLEGGLGGASMSCA